MSWVYAWLAAFGVLCIILFCVDIFLMLVYHDWVHHGGWSKLNKKLHWRRTEREKIMKELEE